MRENELQVGLIKSAVRASGFGWTLHQNQICKILGNSSQTFMFYFILSSTHFILSFENDPEWHCLFFVTSTDIAWIVTHIMKTKYAQICLLKTIHALTCLLKTIHALTCLLKTIHALTCIIKQYHDFCSIDNVWQVQCAMCIRDALL